MHRPAAKPNCRLLETALDPRHFVEVRKTIGGPALEVLSEDIETARKTLANDRSWSEAATRRLEQARTQLESRIDTYLSQAG